ncbi:MAG: LamG-like jellyroll fold domain-containing protein [Candidatus Thermoplasmatota archaeon]
MVGYWKFDEGKGAIVKDYSSFNNHGIVYGNAEWAQGISNSGLLLDGVDDKVTIPDNSSLDITTDITISIWIKLISIPRTNPLVSKGTEGATYSYFLGTGTCYPPLKASFQLHAADEKWVDIRSQTSLSLNKWYHIVGTRCGSSAKLYINGEIENVTVVFSGRLRQNDEPLEFGVHYKTVFSNGIIDEIRLYNRALNDSEVRYLYEHVVEENNPPVADAGGPYVGTILSAINFDGSDCYDPEEKTLTYRWDFGDGNTSWSQNPTHIYTRPGNYTVVLTVTDEMGLTDVDTTFVIVKSKQSPGFEMIFVIITIILVFLIKKSRNYNR